MFATATLDAQDPDRPGHTTRVKLKNVMITSYQTGGSAEGGVPLESLSLNFEQISYSKNSGANKDQ